MMRRVFDMRVPCLYAGGLPLFLHCIRRLLNCHIVRRANTTESVRRLNPDSGAMWIQMCVRRTRQSAAQRVVNLDQVSSSNFSAYKSLYHAYQEFCVLLVVHRPASIIIVFARFIPCFFASVATSDCCHDPCISQMCPPSAALEPALQATWVQSSRQLATVLWYLSRRSATKRADTRISTTISSWSIISPAATSRYVGASLCRFLSLVSVACPSSAVLPPALYPNMYPTTPSTLHVQKAKIQPSSEFIWTYPRGEVDKKRPYFQVCIALSAMSRRLETWLLCHFQGHAT